MDLVFRTSLFHKLFIGIQHMYRSVEMRLVDCMYNDAMGIGTMLDWDRLSLPNCRRYKNKDPCDNQCFIQLRLELPQRLDKTSCSTCLDLSWLISPVQCISRERWKVFTVCRQESVETSSLLNYVEQGRQTWEGASSCFCLFYWDLLFVNHRSSKDFTPPDFLLAAIIYYSMHYN